MSRGGNVDPSANVPEDAAESERDWFQVVAERRCEECGLEARALDRSDLAPAILREARLWSALLAQADPEALRDRPGAERWSALEYACHVRDVLALFTERVERALVQVNPAFGWWDHQAAEVEGRYNDQHPLSVANDLESGAAGLAAAITPLGDAAWSRTGTRRRNEVFTVDALSRFALHEAMHHRVDAELALQEVAPADAEIASAEPPP